MANKASERSLRHRFDFAGRSDFVQTITSSGASALNATTIKRYGVTRIVANGTGAGHTFTLDSPRKGVRKTLIVEGPGTSTTPAFVQTNSSGVTIGETTGNQITFSTTADLNGSAIELIGQSTAAWMLASPMPTGVTIAASTNL